MARPSKAEVEKREKIKELGLFVRDSKSYVVCEETIGKYSKTQAPYIFCELCRIRDSSYIRIKKSDIEYANDILPKINLLKTYNLNLARYFTKIYERGINTLLFLSKAKEAERPYEVYTQIEIEKITKVLGKNKTEKILIDSGFNRSFIKDIIALPLEQIYNHIDREDKKILFKVLGGTTSTVIRSNKTWDRVFYFSDNNVEDKRIDIQNVIQVELDFTKPKEEIIEYISKIKDDFDKNPKSIQNIFGLLDIVENPYICNLQNCDIYKSNNIKPIGGRLSDVLFIYDCKKAGLDNDYIIDEINRYWIDIKNLYKDKFRASTLTEYHNLAKDYIDNGQYRCYLSGYDLTS